MGTPDFARTILERLVADGHDVCGVFTQPDKPRNRNKVTPSPVKEYALSQNIPVFQPVTMRDGTALEDFKTLAPELAVVAAYGRILPEEMLAVPVHGCINAHASILPKYRGAMHMAKECDAGDMILVKKQAIRPDETAEDLFKELAVLGADAIAEAIVEIENGTAQRVPQDESQATYAPMLSRVPGTLCARKKGIEAACGDGKSILITELQPDGGKRMAANAFLNGKRIAAGTVLDA